MLKKSNSSIKNEVFSFLKVISFGLLFSILLASCNSGDSTAKVENKDTVSYQASSNEPAVMVNWLAHWDTVFFSVDKADSLELREEIKKIRAYVRGWLVEYNDSIKARAENNGARSDYVVDKFEFTILSRSPLTYKVKAFLNPQARSSDGSHSHERTGEEEEPGPGGHLIPPPPPPPGRG